MPKTTLKLFTKTWPPKRDAKKEDASRPLTATLEKPSILNISLIGIIDMSTMRKEFLNISNLCRFPLNLSKKKRLRKGPVPPGRPLSLPSPDKGRKKRLDAGDDSCADEESYSIQSAKTVKVSKLKSKRELGSSVKGASLNDANNNNSKMVKIPRKRQGNVIGKLGDVKNQIGKSTKLPEPCKTCGRPDQPERFHSHPVVPVKLTKTAEEPPKMKSTVQKPVAIKYKSKQSVEKKTLPPATARKPSLPAQKLVHTPLVGDGAPKPSSARITSAKRTLTCYICGREFGTASLPLHEPKCLEKWERENASLPTHLQRKAPIKPDHPLTQEEWNRFAWESSQATLTPCSKCGRTFYPDRLMVHQRSCKSENNAMPASSGPEGPSIREKIALLFRNITVEPIILCYIMPSVLVNLTTQNLNLDKACRVNLNLSDATCDALVLRDSTRYSQEDEVAVQKLVASMNAWKNVIQSLIPCVLLLFLGSWSDRHQRRKPCFLAPIVGEMFTCLGLLVCTYYYRELSVEYNVLFEALPPSLTGGWFAMFMAIFSYIGGITSLQTRTFRIGAVNMLGNLSYTLGSALSGVLYKQIGFYGIFSLALVKPIATTIPGPKSSVMPPPNMECYICGKMFGNHSIKIHEKQCLKKWNIENGNLPADIRAPFPPKKENSSKIPKSPQPSSSSLTPEDRPSSAKKSPMFPCYICGRLFTVNSIYIHEPQCLKMWKVDNDKLPVSRRRPQPLKPDVKFTHDGKVDHEATNESKWQSHLSQLIPCRMCSRTFNPDRIDVHERSCKG